MSEFAEVQCPACKLKHAVFPDDPNQLNCLCGAVLTLDREGPTVRISQPACKPTGGRRPPTSGSLADHPSEDPRPVEISEGDFDQLIHELLGGGHTNRYKASLASDKAVPALARIGGARVYRALAHVLASGDYGMPMPEKQMHHLRGVGYRSSHCNHVHKVAYDALKAVGGDAIAPLIETLGAQDADTRMVAAGLLYELGEEKWLYDLIKGEDEEQGDLERLGRCGDPRAVSALLYALSQRGCGWGNWHYRASRLLGQTGDPRAIQPLLDLQAEASKSRFASPDEKRNVEEALRLLTTKRGATVRRIRLRCGGIRDRLAEWLR